MNKELVNHMIEFVRANKPELAKMPIPLYVARLFDEVEAHGYAIRKKSESFKPKAQNLEEYEKKVLVWWSSLRKQEWQTAFPRVDIEGELNKAVLWLRAAAEAGKKKTRLDQFFHNWCSRATQSVKSGPIEPVYASARERLIAEGLRDLSASRSEKLWPQDFAMRLSVALRDLQPIPDQHLAETFRRARAVEMKSTPGIYNVLECWKSLKSELIRKKEEEENKRKLEADRLENERWDRMSPQERDDETRKLREKLEQRKVA